MSKLGGMLLSLTGLILLFNMFGLSTGDTGLIHLVSNPENYQNWNLYTMAGAMVLLLGGIGAVSLFTGSSFKIDFVALGTVGVITLFLSYLGEILSIFTTIAQGSRAFALLVFSPLFILWIVSVIEWWRGVN